MYEFSTNFKHSPAPRGKMLFHPKTLSDADGGAALNTIQAADGTNRSAIFCSDFIEIIAALDLVVDSIIDRWARFGGSFFEVIHNSLR